MASYYPPSNFFQNINFNNDFYAIPNNNQGISLAYANTHYLFSTGVATSTAITTFFSGSVGIGTIGGNAGTLNALNINAINSLQINGNDISNIYVSSNVIPNYLLPYDKITDRQDAITAVNNNLTNNYYNRTSIDTSLNLKQNNLTFSSPFINNANTISINLSAYDLITDRQAAITTVNNNLTNNYYNKTTIDTSLNLKQNNLTFSSPLTNNANTISINLSAYDLITDRQAAINTVNNVLNTCIKQGDTLSGDVKLVQIVGGAYLNIEFNASHFKDIGVAGLVNRQFNLNDTYANLPTSKNNVITWISPLTYNSSTDTASIDLSSYSTTIINDGKYLKLDGTNYMALNSSITLTGTGKFSGDGSLLTNLPLSSYSTTGNDANYLKLSTGGTLPTGNITLTAGTFIGKHSGDGSALTNLPLGSYSTTIINDGKYLKLDGTNSMALNSSITLTGTGKFIGDGSLLTNLPLGSYSTTSINDGKYLKLDGTNNMALNSSITLTGTGKFSGDGSLLTNLPLGSYSTTSINDTKYLKLDGTNNMALNSSITLTGTGTFIGKHSGDGSSITALDYAKITIGKPTNFQADWTSTVINKPSTFPADMTNIYTKTQTDNISTLTNYSTTTITDGKYLKLDGTNTMTGNLNIYNTSLSRSIYLSQSKTTLQIQMRNFFASKKPFAIYFAEDFNTTTNILPNYISNGRDATTTGTITKTTAAGNGATAAIPFLTGTTSSTISFATGSIPTTFTILSLTRYNGGTRQRVLTSKTTGNWFQGHWNNRRGVVQYEISRVSIAYTNNLDDWVCVVGKNVGSNPGSILVDGAANGLNSNGTGNYNLGINNGIYPGEYSDWAFNCVMIWDTALTDAEMVVLNTMIDTYKSSGVSMKQYFFDECSIENIEFGAIKQRELLLFKSNTDNISTGTDRIRLKAKDILFDTFSSPTTDKTVEETKMIIKSSGNVGIGTTNPTMKLSINGNIFLTDTLYVGQANNYPEIRLGSTDGNNLGIATAAGGFSSSALVGDMVIRGFNRLLLQAGNGAAAIVIDGANNVNVSTDLTVNGNTTISGFLTCNNKWITLSTNYQFAGGNTYCAGFYLNNYPNIVNGKTFLIDASVTQSGLPTSISTGLTQIINNPGPTTSGNVVVKTLYISSNTAVNWYNAFTNWNDGLNIYTYGTNLNLVCTIRFMVLG